MRAVPRPFLNSCMQRLLKDPLVHFVVLGVLLFTFHQGILSKDQESPDPRTIVVGEEALLEFMQFRSRAFDPKVFRRRLAGMPARQRQELIDDFIREEVLYREAQAMGLGENDYIIRRRLVQKLEFVTESLSRKAADLTQDEIEAYFEAHRNDYAIESHVTFTHVFFDAERHGDAAANRLAKESLETLNQEGIRFDEAVQFGDRFPFHLNYVDRTREFVVSHFGEPMAQEIFRMPVDKTRWQGPLTSPYGAHLIMITGRTDGRPALLAEIEPRVRQDAEIQRKNDVMRQTVDEMVERYDVRVELSGVMDP